MRICLVSCPFIFSMSCKFLQKYIFSAGGQKDAGNICRNGKLLLPLRNETGVGEVADGHSQVYCDSLDIIIGFRRNGCSMDLVDSRSRGGYYFNQRAMARKKKQKGGLTMGTLIGSVLVVMVAVIGVLYFNHQDKVEARKHNRKQ